MNARQTPIDSFRAILGEHFLPPARAASINLCELQKAWQTARAWALNGRIKPAEILTEIQVNTFLAWLNSGSVEAKVIAAEVLSAIMDSRAFDPVLRMVSDINPDLRVAAVQAIGFWAKPSVTDALLAAASDAITAVRLAALQWLAVLTKEPGVYELLVNLYEHATDDRVRSAAGFGLYMSGDPRCLPLTLQYAQHKNWKIRQQAVSIIGQIRDPNALGALQALRNARSDPKPQVRKAAYVGLAWWADYQKNKQIIP